MQTLNVINYMNMSKKTIQQRTTGSTNNKWDYCSGNDSGSGNNLDVLISLKQNLFSRFSRGRYHDLTDFRSRTALKKIETERPPAMWGAWYQWWSRRGCDWFIFTFQYPKKRSEDRDPSDPHPDTRPRLQPDPVTSDTFTFWKGFKEVT